MAGKRTMICKNCGATMEVDEDKNILYCPYCGSKELIENDDPELVQLLKEEHKYHERAQKEGREMKDKTAQTIYAAVLIAAFVIGTIYVLHVFW